MKLYNVKTVALFLDLSERRVRQLRDEGIITEERPGYFDLQAANRQYIRYLREERKDGSGDYKTERARLVRAKRENEEYDLALKKKELHSAEDIRQILGSMLTSFKTRLMAIPARSSPILAKTQDETAVFALLKKNIDEALEELSDFDSAFIVEEGNDEDGD